MASIVKEYYKNGNLKSEVFVNNGIKEGVYKKYHINGQLETIGNNM